MDALQGLEVEGESNLASAVQIAQLALKHRQNKNQRQRIVMFVGSPITEDKVSCSKVCNSCIVILLPKQRADASTLMLLQEQLVKIAKKLKKNNVAVDVVSFGAEEENTEKLEAFQVSFYRLLLLEKSSVLFVSKKQSAE